MRIPEVNQRRGIALVIVLISIFVLSILAAGFAYSMKIETRLAQHANNETELQWLGRSGVEFARWLLVQQASCPAEPYDALNQIWAGGGGGPCATNGPLAEIPEEITLGHGSFKRPKIVDLERKWNINTTIQPGGEAILQQALMLMGVDAADMTPIVGAILDWIDADDATHLEGAESDEYERQDPPYSAKNGPMDDISELLLVRGITPEMFSATNAPPDALAQRHDPFGRPDLAPAYNVGFVELFTTISSGKLNINTASAEALQLIPGVDRMTAEEIVSSRSGENDGSGLAGPFLNVSSQYLLTRGVNLQAAQRIQQYCDIRSRTFQVEVTATVGGSTRTFYAVIVRPSPRDAQIVNFYWKY